LRLFSVEDAMALLKLNGWQRLWVVASLVWLVVLAALLIIDSVPPSVDRLEARLARDKAEIQREWVYATTRSVPRTIFRLNPPGNWPEGFTLDDLTTDQIRDFYKRMSDEEPAEAIHDKFPGVDFGPAELPYRIKLSALQIEHQGKVDSFVGAGQGEMARKKNKKRDNREKNLMIKVLPIEQKPIKLSVKVGSEK